MDCYGIVIIHRHVGAALLFERVFITTLSNMLYTIYF